MKIVVTHSSPDWDAITSVWLLKRFLPGWENAAFKFVPAGQRVAPLVGDSAIEHIGGDEVIHVDTGLGPLDHHQTSDKSVCGASRTWDFVQQHNPEFQNPASEKAQDNIEAIDRIVRVVVDIDHFGEVFWPDAAADYQEFSLLGVLEGLKSQKQDDDDFYTVFGMECLDALIHEFDNRIWAEKEIKKGKEFETRFGKAIAFETINDTVIKLSQKMGYVLVIRKDPRKGYVRIKARPEEPTPAPRATPPVEGNNMFPSRGGEGDSQGRVSHDKSIDLTLAYEQLSKMDPQATWYLHVSKKMLLNGTPKNPKMVPTTLSLQQIIDVIKKV